MAPLLVAALVCGGCGTREVLVAVPGRLAVTRVVRDELNERGMRDVQLIEDIGHMPMGRLGAIEYAARLPEVPGVTVVVGPSDSRTALMTAPYYSRGRLAQVLPTATAAALAEYRPWTLTLAPGDSVEGEFMAAFVADSLRSRRASIFFLNDEYGVGLYRALRRSLAARGVAVVDAVYYGAASCAPDGAGDFAQLVPASFARGRPDVLIVAGRDGDAGCLLRQARLAAPGLPVVLADGVEITGFMLERAGPAAESAYAVTFWGPEVQDSASRAFRERFRRVEGREPTAGEGLFYEAVWLAVEAARRGRGDRALTRDALETAMRSPRRLAGPGDTASLRLVQWRSGRRVTVASW